MANEYMEVPGEIIGEQVIVTENGLQIRQNGMMRFSNLEFQGQNGWPNHKTAPFQIYPGGLPEQLPFNPGNAGSTTAVPAFPSPVTARPYTVKPVFEESLNSEPVLGNMVISLSQQLTNLSVRFSVAVGKAIHYRVETHEKSGLHFEMSLWVRCEELQKDSQLYCSYKELFDRGRGEPIPKQLLWRLALNDLMDTIMLGGLARVTRQVLELEDEVGL